MEISLIPILISGFSLLISIGLAVYSGYNSNRLKLLEASLEVQKNKSLLNDKKNREIFDTFIKAFIKLMFDKKDKTDKQKNEDAKLLEKDMIEIKKILLINGSGRLVREFNNFVLLSQSEQKTDIEFYASINRLLIKFREEIGVENEGLNKNDLLQLFVNEDINKKLKI